MNKQPAHKLSLAVQYASGAQIMPTRAQLRRWVKSALQRDVRMTLRIVDEAEGRELNKKYRSKDYATNVLTFVYDDADMLPGDTDFLCGDAVICAPVVEQEAAAQHKELLAHYAHLAIHAALHLQGHDHENDSDAAEMEALETALMLKLHYPDPYQTTQIANGRPGK
ncbi:MAG: rRNA maturation RNase YbeY [Gallionella sp.]|nr:rRNA maturation RNase YbeY [Gallionella sp.]